MQHGAAADQRIVVALLRTLEIDVAVDLNGYTADGRTGVFARRAAPVQASYLGYPDTMGAPFIDYLIADANVIPPAARAHYAENVVCLPDVFQANDRAGGEPVLHAGVPELATSTLEAYEALGADLAADRVRLADLRGRIAGRRDTCPLFDTARFCRNLEAAYERMWARHRSGEAPVPFTVPPAT